MKPRAIAGALSLVLAAGLFVAGCSSLPSSSSVTGPPDAAPTGVDTTVVPQPIPTAPVVSVSRSVYVRALLGGTVSAGNFSVIVPPLALRDDAIVTVRQPDPTKPVVELSITPEDRNAFLLPVLLVADVSAMDSAKVPAATISWWNPVASQWEPCAGTLVDVAGLRIQAPLTHFSTYRVESNGKAGW